MDLIDMICDKKFTSVHKGYSPKQVDEFLDEICDEIERKKSTNNAEDKEQVQKTVHITSDDILNKKFGMVANGYSPEEVHFFLRFIADELSKDVSSINAAKEISVTPSINNTQHSKTEKNISQELESNCKKMDPVCISFVIIAAIIFIVGVFFSRDLASSQTTELVGVYNPHYETKSNFSFALFLASYIPYFSAGCLSVMIALVSYKLNQIINILRNKNNVGG